MHRLIATFHTPMILLNGLYTNDKFCMIRKSHFKLRWARRPRHSRDQPISQTEYLHDETRHGGGAHETSMAGTSPVQQDGERGTALGSSLPTPSAMEHAERTAAYSHASRFSEIGGGKS